LERQYELLQYPRGEQTLSLFHLAVARVPLFQTTILAWFKKYPDIYFFKIVKIET
jgi:hypothetical protein